MQATVIISTYNQPQWLQHVLDGFAVQTVQDFEVVIADDGSNSDTRAVIDQMRQRAPYPIIHVWHEDHGFRKCAILNKAILTSTTDYLIFTDGDCIPAPWFVERHLALRERGRFLSGGYVKLPMLVCHRIAQQHVLHRQVTRPSWLRRMGVPTSTSLLKLRRSSFIGRIFDAITTTRPTWNGHNASTWKDYLIQAGGFDERMVYGGEDRELGERLENAGIRGKQVRYRIGCIHLDHPRGYVSTEGLDENNAIRAHTRQSRVTVTEHSSIHTLRN